MSEEKESYYSRNRDKQLALATAYRNAHKEQYKQYWKTYYEKNKSVLLKKRAQYARKNKEKIYYKYKTIYYPRHQQKNKNQIQDPVPATAPETTEVPSLPPILIFRGNHTVSFE